MPEMLWMIRRTHNRAYNTRPLQSRQFLAHHYDAMIAQLDPTQAPTDLHRRLGEHLFVLYADDLQDSHERLQHFFARAAKEVRTYVLQFAGEVLGNPTLALLREKS